MICIITVACGRSEPNDQPVRAETVAACPSASLASPLPPPAEKHPASAACLRSALRPWSLHRQSRPRRDNNRKNKHRPASSTSDQNEYYKYTCCKSGVWHTPSTGCAKTPHFGADLRFNTHERFWRVCSHHPVPPRPYRNASCTNRRTCYWNCRFTFAERRCDAGLWLAPR